MTPMLEKAARARARALARSRIYDGYSAEMKEMEFLRNKSILFAEVRVVLGAIRDPDEATTLIMFDDGRIALDAWRATIDAILGEKGSSDV